MKLRAALKQRLAFKDEIGFCSTKFAPISKARWVVVLPFKMANDTEFLLLGVLRRVWRSCSPPCRSSQSTMTASNFSESRTSSPALAALQTSTRIESFSSVGRRTRCTDTSPLIRRDSSTIPDIHIDDSRCNCEGESDQSAGQRDSAPCRNVVPLDIRIEQTRVCRGRRLQPKFSLASGTAKQETVHCADTRLPLTRVQPRRSRGKFAECRDKDDGDRAHTNRIILLRNSARGPGR